MRFGSLPWLCIGAITTLGSARAAGDVGALRLAELPSEGRLAELLWERSPDLEAARAKAAVAAADLDKAYLLPNPGLDLGWGTIPIGTTNPVGLAAPLAHVPNYSVSLSVLLEIGKRGWRQEAAKNASVAAFLDAREQLRQRYHELVEHLGELAAAEVRIATLEGLAQDAARLTELQKERAQHGDAAGLDADRAALEEQKIQVSLQEETTRFFSELLACSHLVGVRCEPFGERGHAETFLARRPGVVGDVEQRPDLAALSAQERSAEASAFLARAYAIPDPTVRLGYLRDQFIISGNQQNSLFLGLSLPLPLFDHGQTDARAAVAQKEAAARTRQLLLEQARRDLTQLAQQARKVDSNRASLRERTLPLARSVVERLEIAVQRGGAPMTELLLVRRTLGELLIDGVDLDLAAFRIRVATERASGALPVLVSKERS